MRAKQKAIEARDEMNSYKIRLNNLAITKQGMADEIIAEIKEAIISKINEHKGNLSKSSACIIVKNTVIPRGDSNE